MRTTADHRLRRALMYLVLGAIVIAASPGAAAPTGGEDGVTFTLRAPEAGAVFLAGDFNGWNASDLALARGEDGTWTVQVKLDPGKYEYKFVVDGAWLEDPGNPVKVTDPFGGSNSVVTVRADGSTASTATAAPKPVAKKSAAKEGDVKLGRPRAVEGGVLFTYDGPQAGGVFLAGNFNEWNATALPLTRGGNGVWSIVHPLPAGKHEYKFVVDGAWFADPENPDTQADPYGGANSLVTLDGDGNLVKSEAAAASDERPRSNTSLNARVNLNGRYLTRFEVAQGVYGDPRFRMQRPLQTVDLNFDTQVSDVAETMFRMRLDSGQNIIQNNVAAFMDEAYLRIDPGTFRLKAYWNQEIYHGDGPMLLGGDIDLPGTIGPDHLGYGKGTAGALFEAQPFGTQLRAFVANVHNQDYYNDPDLFDNTGQDRVALRLSRAFGGWEFGLPAYFVRSLNKYSFSSYTDGLPTFDAYRNESGDSSEDYHAERRRVLAGGDLGYTLREDLVLSGQFMAGDEFQGLIWGNKSGLGGTPASIDVPILERQSVNFMLRADWTPGEHAKLLARHSWSRSWGGQADQRDLAWSYLPQASAQNRVYYEAQPAPAQLDDVKTELEFDWNSGTRDLKLWVWRLANRYDYAAVGRTVEYRDEEFDSVDEEIWYLSASYGGGDPSTDAGRSELLFGGTFTSTDLARPISDHYELIYRYDLDLSRRVGFVADIRYVNYPKGPHGDSGAFLASDNDFLNPFVGLRYDPIPAMRLVLAYGVDPVDLSIDYEGRDLGRWWYRQRYLFENPGATQQDAESHLADARVITLRAQVRF